MSKINQLIEDNIGLAIVLCGVFILTLIPATMLVASRLEASSKKELFAACVLTGGKPELCLIALRESK